MVIWSGTILGETYSKANSRMAVPGFSKRTQKSYMRFIKNDAVRAYVEAAKSSLPTLSPLFTCDLKMTANIYYASRRKDLDESLLMDIMEGYIYKNDRQIKEKHIFWGLDKENPRAEIVIETLDKL